MPMPSTVTTSRPATLGRRAMQLLIARYVGASAAQSMARLMLLDWHSEGQAPYVGFLPTSDHDDAMVRDLQKWLETHFSTANPIEEMALRCGLSSRSLERRFMKAAGLAPLAYAYGARASRCLRQLPTNGAVAVERLPCGALGLASLAYACGARAPRPSAPPAPRCPDR